MRKQTTAKKFAFALLAGSLGFLTVMQQPAFAIITDPSAYAKLQNMRQSLIVRQNQLRKDQDDIARDLDDLKARNTDRQFDQSIDQLSRKLDDKYFQLKQTQSDLRDVERMMI